MRIAFLFFVSILLFNCQNPSYDVKKERIMNRVIREASVKLKKEKNLYFFGDGGQAMDQIVMLGLSFNYYKSINIQEASTRP